MLKTIDLTGLSADSVRQVESLVETLALKKRRNPGANETRTAGPRPFSSMGGSPSQTRSHQSTTARIRSMRGGTGRMKVHAKE